MPYGEVVIIGGDLRQEYMARILAGRGVGVVTYGLGDALREKGGAPQVDNVGRVAAGDEAVGYDSIRRARVVIAPIPLSGDGVRVSGDEETITVNQLTEALCEGQTFYAGNVPKGVWKACEEKGIDVVDFLEFPGVAVFNTIATAEGAICEAMMRHPSNLHDAECFVLGFGRCARTLADKLKGLSARVSVCARLDKARAEAYAYGYRAISFEDVREEWGRYDVIFNTVPAKVLDGEALGETKEGVVIIDIASFPGGVDYDAAQRLGRGAWLCPGLPGKYSPHASALELLRYVVLG